MASTCKDTGGRVQRTKKQRVFLRLARLTWYDVLDGGIPQTGYVMDHIDRLLRRAKANRNDL